MGSYSEALSVERPEKCTNQSKNQCEKRVLIVNLETGRLVKCA